MNNNYIKTKKTKQIYFCWKYRYLIKKNTKPEHKWLKWRQMLEVIKQAEATQLLTPIK